MQPLLQNIVDMRELNLRLQQTRGSERLRASCIRQFLQLVAQRVHRRHE